jgi:hypothetical protein
MKENAGGQFRAEIGWSLSSGIRWSLSAENAIDSKKLSKGGN